MKVAFNQDSFSTGYFHTYETKNPNRPIKVNKSEVTLGKHHKTTQTTPSLRSLVSQEVISELSKDFSPRDAFIQGRIIMEILEGMEIIPT